MTHALAVIAFTLAALTACGDMASPTTPTRPLAGWQHFVDPDGHFTAEFPAMPTASVSGDETKWTLVRSHAGLSVWAVDLHIDMRGHTLDGSALLASSMDALLGTTPEHVIRRVPLTVGGVAAEDIWFSSATDAGIPLTGRARVFLMLHDQAILVIAEGVADPAGDPSVLDNFAVHVVPRP